MRLAFSISGHRPAVDAVRAAVAAEAAGLADVWVTEDYCERGAFALAGAIAATTSRVRVGIGVVNPWTRHPALIAMEFAALDEISEGRAILGLGTSNPTWMREQLGIPFERPLGRLEESIEVVRALLGGEQVSHRGTAFTVDARLAFTPVRMAPPVVLGVKGQLAMKLAARQADGVLMSILAGPDYVRWVRQQVGPQVELAAYVGLSVDRDAAAARDRIRPMVATFLGVHGDHVITRTAGIDAERAAAFRAGWRSGEPRTDLVDDTMLDRLVAAGTAADAAATFRLLAEAGLDVAVVRDDPTVDPAETLADAVEVAASSR